MKRRLVYSRACTKMLLSPLPFNLQEISLYITGPKEKHYLHIICKTISHPYDPYSLTFSIKKHISVLFVSFHIVRQNSPFFFPTKSVPRLKLTVTVCRKLPSAKIVLAMKT